VLLSLKEGRCLCSVEWIGLAGVAAYIAAPSVGLVASVLVSADASAWAKARCFFFLDIFRCLEILLCEATSSGEI
jgi:hypothetical protein